jgi:hypothetical protein
MGFLSNLFGGKKPKETCPICGQPMGFFSKTELTDGAICDSCVARAQSLIGNRLIAEMSIDAVKSVIAEEEEVNAKLVAAFGSEYPNLFKTEFAHPISPKATDVGIARAKLMKNAVAAKGTVVSGSFDKGTVTVIRHGTTFEAELCETAPFTEGEDVESTLAAHLYKGAVGAGKTAWLILNGESGVTSGDLIGTK